MLAFMVSSMLSAVATAKSAGNPAPYICFANSPLSSSAIHCSPTSSVWMQEMWKFVLSETTVSIFFFRIVEERMASARRWCSVKSSATCSCPCGCCSRQSSKSKGDIRLSATCNLPTCAWCAAHSVNHEVQLRDAKHPVMHRGRLADAQAFHLRQLRTYTAVVAISLQNPFAETTKVRRVLPRQQVARPAKPCAMVCAFSQRHCIVPWTGFLTSLPFAHTDRPCSGRCRTPAQSSSPVRRLSRAGRPQRLAPPSDFAVGLCKSRASSPAGFPLADAPGSAPA